MVGIVVVTHGALARELLQAAEMIIGPFPLVEAVSVDRERAVDSARQELEQALGQVGHDGDGVIVMTDMFGGTPTNISAEFLSEGQVDIICGVNLPLLIKCINGREGMTLDELAGMLKEYGRNTILRPKDLFQRNN